MENYIEEDQELFLYHDQPSIFKEAMLLEFQNESIECCTFHSSDFLEEILASIEKQLRIEGSSTISIVGLKFVFVPVL
jgi:hypothetical protein